MHADHHIKRFFFKWNALIAVIIIVIVAVLVLPRMEWQAFAAIAAVVLSFAFGVQKQNLEEIKLFKKLFEQFNARYDAMDADLNRIYQQTLDREINEDEKMKLFKYFNLCGEEYLYFSKGFIYWEVWHAWENGMKYFQQNPRIKKLWDDELKGGSYYGLKF
jgi:type II secretory pathway pseudopilin PulG